MTIASDLYDWAKEIKPDLKKLDSIPLTGSPPFPWDEFSSRLARSFDREGLVIRPGELAWRAKENLYEGLGDSPFPLIFSIPSLQGQVCWVMPSQEMNVLAALLLTHESHPLTLHDSSLNESFYHFLALEVLYNLTQISFDKTLLPILTNQTTLPNQDSLCWDISLQLQGQTIWGRLLISPEFRRSWVEHFALLRKSTVISQDMAKLVDVTIHVEAGKTELLLSQWKSVQPGDFILLDQCTLNPESLDGRVLLTINGKPTYRAKLKNGTLKILELPLLHEVNTPMAKYPEEDDVNESDFSENNEEFEEEDDNTFDETEESDLFTEEENMKTETALETPSKPRTSEADNQKLSTSAERAKERLIAPEQIPIVLRIEIGQIQMTMDKLLLLEPGNMLDIAIHPENGVDLTINGKVVGKGELIRIGETLGVRVLEIGR